MKITQTQYPNIVSLMKKIYSDYKGRKFFIQAQTDPLDTTSYWDEGSRTYFKFVRLDGKEYIPPTPTPWIQVKENRMVVLQPGLVCVTHAFSQGYDCGLTIYLNPADIPKRLNGKFIYE